ncbi:MAG TPA: AsmA-like C-terminal domain-containing protein [Thermohalobaculum sp.]|nr:AsmA-like C-terminal domain-containing protein [Thermohalobaculum sp.]
MAFLARIKKRARPPRRSRLAYLVLGPVWSMLHLALSAAGLAVVLLGLVYLRLTQGPIHLPAVAEVAARMFNEQSSRVRVQAGDFILTLGEQGEPSGLQFLDVRVENTEGAVLFAIPRLAASFGAGDLIAGRLWPQRIAVIGPEARFLLTADGQLRFGLGTEFAALSGGAGDSDAAELQFEAVERVIGGFVGDVEPAPEVSRLSRIDILDAALTYENEAAARIWRTRRADLRVFRLADGARVRLDVGLADASGDLAEDASEDGAALVVIAERRKGAGATRVTGRFDQLRPEHLAEQIDQMEWLRLFDAPLSGRLAATVHDGGTIEGLTGELDVGAGRILALGDDGQPIRRARLGFSYEPGLERMLVTRFDLESQALDARLSGFADLIRDGGGEVAGLAGQLEIAQIRLNLPAAFADPLSFDGGQIVARMALEPMRIDVGEAHLRRGDLVFDVTGTARLAEDVWHTDLRAGARNVTVEGLLAHWPVTAVPGVREWISKNITRADIGELVAQMRFIGREPELALDFAYSGLDSSYLEDMSPIRNARGRGALTLDSFHLLMDAGEVEPVAGAPVRLDGSEIEIPDLNAGSTPAVVTLRAAGPTASVLTLIDEEPLGLTRKLGLDPAVVEGNSEVIARLDFPLISALKLNDVEVSANAVLRDLRMPFVLPNGNSVDVAAGEVALDADISEMHFAGDASIDGRAMAIDWNEYYGRGKSNRAMTFRGNATPALLAKFNIGDRNFADGEAPMTLTLEQTGTPEYAFQVSADIGPARIEIPELGWTKPPGARGKLDAAGSFGDGGVRVDRFTLDTHDLVANGAVEFGGEGYIRSANVARAQYLGLADIGAEVRRGAGDAYLVKLTGSRVDLAVLDGLPDGPGGDRSEPIDMAFELDELTVTPRIVARPASGTYRRGTAFDRSAHLEGMADGRVAFAADYTRNGDEPGRLEVSSDQAGEFMAAANLFASARGGTLRMKAILAPDEATDMTGLANISDVTVHGTGTFTTILDQGGVTDAAVAAKESGGLYFDSVRLPFEYGGGRLLLDDATAKGKLLAIKTEGEVDENTGKIDLVGVISPAYALTGLLNNIPLLGTILSGGKDEGITAMTFSVGGTMQAPEISVNPLSLLAPGILRTVFSGRAERPNERFMQQLQREEN